MGMEGVLYKVRHFLFFISRDWKARGQAYIIRYIIKASRMLHVLIFWNVNAKKQKVKNIQISSPQFTNKNSLLYDVLYAKKK